MFLKQHKTLFKNVKKSKLIKLNHLIVMKEMINQIIHFLVILMINFLASVIYFPDFGCYYRFI